MQPGDTIEWGKPGYPQYRGVIQTMSQNGQYLFVQTQFGPTTERYITIRADQARIVNPDAPLPLPTI